MESGLDKSHTDGVGIEEMAPLLLGETIICSSEYCASAELIRSHVSSYLLTSRTDQQSSDEMTVLGSCLTVARHTLHEFYLSLYRRFRLHRNDRESILSHEDQLIAIQLVLAEKNKKDHGEFDAAVSSVLESWRHLVECRLSKRNDCETDGSNDTAELLKGYESFKRDCNMVDWLDVYQTVMRKSSGTEELRSCMRDSNFLIVNPNPSDTLEVEMIRLLCESGKSLKRAVMQLSLDESFSHQMGTPTSASISLESFNVDELKTISACKCEEHQLKKSPISESYIEQIFLGYLELLVNSRNELSLARVINVPDRAINHSAFTDIKHATKACGLSMYQTITSYVVRLRLGGRGYSVSTSNSLLNRHTKGLADFTDLMHSLQTRIEENPEPEVALKKVIGLIKRCLSSKTSKLMSRQSLDTVAERILETITKTIEHLSTSSTGTPTRSVSDGSTNLGRRTLRVVRAMLDQYSARSTPRSSADVLGDLYTSQGTPVCLPSLLSKFRSPEDEASTDNIKPLVERLTRHDVDIPKKKKIVSDGRVKSGFTWASEDSNSMSADMMDYIRNSSTIVHPAAAPAVQQQQQRKVSAKRSLPLSPGKENIHPATELSSLENSVAKSARKGNMFNDSNTDTRGSAVNGTKGKAATVGKAVHTGGGKGGPKKSITNKKVKPLIPGQTKLSSFFK